MRDERRRLRRGLTLVELLIAAGLIGVAVILAAQVMKSLFHRSQVITRASEAETRRATFRLLVANTVRGAFRGRVHLAPTLANYMGIGAQLGWTAFGATEGALLVSLACALPAGAVNCVPETGGFQAVAILGAVPLAGVLTLTTERSIGPPLAAVNGEFDLPVTGATAGHAVGEVLGMSTPLGAQFVRLVSIGSGPDGATLRVRSLYDGGLPATALAAGTPLFRATITVVGRVAGEDRIQMLRYEPATGATTLLAEMPIERLGAEGTFRVERLLNMARPAEPGSWEIATRRSFFAQNTDFMLRVTWRRTSLAASQARAPSADNSMRESMEIGL